MVAKLLRRDTSLFLTHTPEAFQPGARWEDREGRPFVVTRLKALVPTRLLNGGLMPCYEVFGRLLPDEEVEEVRGS